MQQMVRNPDVLERLLDEMEGHLRVNGTADALRIIDQIRSYYRIGSYGEADKPITPGEGERVYAVYQVGLIEKQSVTRIAARDINEAIQAVQEGCGDEQFEETPGHMVDQRVVSAHEVTRD